MKKLKILGKHRSKKRGYIYLKPENGKTHCFDLDGKNGYQLKAGQKPKKNVSKKG